MGWREALLQKTAYIEHKDGWWHVRSHKGKSLGKYKTEGEAKKRLKQIEFWKHNK